MNAGSTYPKAVIKHIAKETEFRLSRNSSSKNIYEEKKKRYERELIKDTTKIESQTPKHQPMRHTKRKRNIIWFKTPNQPFNFEVKSSIGKTFFRLLDKNFPKITNCVKSLIETP